MGESKAWWLADEGEVHSKLMDYVREVERNQASFFESLVQFAYLYDPNDPGGGGDMPREKGETISENVCASNVDSAFAAIAATEVRVRHTPDQADWSTQRQARDLECYGDGLGKLLDLHGVARSRFNDCAKKGTGFAKVYSDYGDICVERVMVDDIIYDVAECRAGGKPKQMFQRVLVDRDELIERYPEAEEAIESSDGADDHRRWAGYRPLADNEIVVIEGWRFAKGKKGSDGYRKGRHVIVIEGKDILDEEWSKPRGPFAKIVWSERTASPYGIGLIERIVGHQRVINRYNWLTEAWIRRHAMPTTYVRTADAALTVKTQNPLGNIATYTADKPETVWPQAVSPEVTARRQEAKDSAYEETGMSRLAATSKKPAGLESGVALREYRDQTTQRFSQQEKAFEKFYLDLMELVLECAKELGDSAPEIATRKGRYHKKFKWADVDMDGVKIQMQAASDISRTPAGRIQQALEWAQAGVITTDSFREMISDLDIDSEFSLYRAAQEAIDGDIEAILEGEIVGPEAYDNLALAVWRAQQRYHIERANGCPEEILEGLRQYIVQAVHMQEPPEQPLPADAPMAGSEPVDPLAALDPMAAAIPTAAPPGAQPMAALAPEAMNLLAG